MMGRYIRTHCPPLTPSMFVLLNEVNHLSKTYIHTLAGSESYFIKAKVLLPHNLPTYLSKPLHHTQTSNPSLQSTKANTHSTTHSTTQTPGQINQTRPTSSMPFFYSKPFGGRRAGGTITADRHGLRRPVFRFRCCGLNCFR